MKDDCSLFDRQGNYKDLNFVLLLFVKRFIYVPEELLLLEFY